MNKKIQDPKENGGEWKVGTFLPASSKHFLFFFELLQVISRFYTLGN